MQSCSVRIVSLCIFKLRMENQFLLYLANFLHDINSAALVTFECVNSSSHNISNMHGTVVVGAFMTLLDCGKREAKIQATFQYA
jgi:hypothetical protein